MKRMSSVVDTKNAMLLACIAFRTNDNRYVPTNKTIYKVDEHGNTVFTKEGQPVVLYNSNKSVMLDMIRQEAPYEITQGDKELFQKIEPGQQIHCILF